MYVISQYYYPLSHFFHVHIYAVEVISSGDVKVSLNYGTIPIVNETLDLCDLVTQVKRKCPLKDNLKFSLTENIPSYVPSVSLTKHSSTNCSIILSFNRENILVNW